MQEPLPREWKARTPYPLTSIVPTTRTIELIINGRYIDLVRPLFHPALEDITVEGVLHALSDRVRACIFADIAASACPQTCSSYLKVSDRSVPKSTLSQHFKALRDAGLIRRERLGLEMLNTARCLELEKRFPGLISAIVNAHCVQTKERRKAAKGARKTVASQTR
jgi:DNA-binding transcriptional ArsR family regulator